MRMGINLINLEKLVRSDVDGRIGWTHLSRVFLAPMTDSSGQSRFYMRVANSNTTNSTTISIRLYIQFTFTIITSIDLSPSDAHQSAIFARGRFIDSY